MNKIQSKQEGGGHLSHEAHNDRVPNPRSRSKLISGLTTLQACQVTHNPMTGGKYTHSGKETFSHSNQCTNHMRNYTHDFSSMLNQLIPEI